MKVKLKIMNNLMVSIVNKTKSEVDSANAWDADTETKKKERFW